MSGETARPKAAVFLDRDGVINQAQVRQGIPHPPASMRELVILPGVSAALHALKRQGYMLIVVTNQPDVARGATSLETISSIHRHLEAHLALDGILACLHDEADACDCRKPKPGLLLQAQRAHRLDLKSSFMVGDRWRDIEAGRRAGCTTVWIDRGYAERPARDYHFKVRSLPEAAAMIRSRTVPRP